MNKAQLLHELADLRTEWARLLATVSPAQAGTPGIAGDWTLADLVYHIAWYEQEMVRLLIALRLDGSPLWALPHDERNQKIREAGRKRSWATLLTLSDVTHQALVAALTAVPEAALYDPASFAGMPADWRPLALLAENTTSHYRQHLPALRAWLAAENTA